MSNNVIEGKPAGTQVDEPNANQTSDAKDRPSSASAKGLPAAFEGVFDVKTVASLAGAFAFVLGWVYNLGFFSTLNYDYMDVLTINDYVLSTLTALPLALFMMVVWSAIGILLNKPFTLAGDAIIRFGIKSNWKSTTTLAVIAFFQVLGLVGGIIVFVTLFKLSIMPNSYAFNLAIGIVLLFAIGANGAADARNYMKGDFLLDTKVSSTTQEAESAYLVRSLSAGAIVIYPQLNKLAFIPKERIQYYSSVVQINRIFDWKYFR